MKYKSLFLFSITAIALFSFQEIICRYYFYYMEQLQLFLFVKRYAIQVTNTVGGCSDYIARFLVQYFKLPGMGAFITTFLLLAMLACNWGIIKKKTLPATVYWIASVPVLFFLLLQVDLLYKLQGTVAFLIMLLGLLAYVYVNKSSFRLLCGALLLPIIYWMAGPVVVLFVLGASLWELSGPKKGWLLAMCLPVEYGAIIGLSLRLGVESSWSNAILPSLYYDASKVPPAAYYPWIAFLLMLVLTLFYRFNPSVKSPSVKKDLFSIGIQLLPMLLMFAWLSTHEDTTRNSRIKQDHFLREKQWDQIIKTYNVSQSDNLQSAVLYLALAEKGDLGDKMFSYKPKGVESLLPQWDNTLFSSITLSDIYYGIGDIATAQKYAFEGSVSSIQGGSVRLLQRLVETNLIFGSYKVAEKYIFLLERTSLYRAWATGMRKFLYHDALLVQDPVLGSKRKALMGTGDYAVSSIVTKTLEQLAVHSADNQMALQYLTSLYLLNKDRNAFRSFLERYYGTEVWPRLSTLSQEAVLTLERDNPKYWLQHGVSLQVSQRFKAFNSDLSMKQSYYNVKEEIASSYGDTYWFYLIFDK